MHTRRTAQNMALIAIRMFVLLALGAALFGSALTVMPAGAIDSTIAVSTTTDEYDNVAVPGAGCSLREAITAANGNSTFGGCTTGTFGVDTITVPAGTYTLTRAGAAEDANATGDLDILESLTINGAGASATIIQAGSLGYPDVNANGIDRVMQLSGTVILSDLTIANGKCSTCIGGGLWNGNGTLTINNSVFSGNAAVNSSGGAIFHMGSTTITNSTFSGNSASIGGAIVTSNGTLNATNSTFSGNSADFGGGLYISPDSTVNLKNDTFSGNSAVTYGGGIVDDGVLNMANTILANSVSGADCYNDTGDTITTNTSNLIETNSGAGYMCGTPAVTGDPLLGALALNGGTTPNFSLLAASPALDTGDLTTCTTAPVNSTSQNGVSRPRGAGCDIGSFEAGYPFFDVPVLGKEWMEPWIVAFYNAGITTGCNPSPLSYCPENQVTRAEMAVFLLRAKHGSGYAPPVPTHDFADVPVTGKEWMEPWIEQFYAEGITTGCGGGNYCPENNVTRAEMAVFVLRALNGGGYSPPAATHTFSDVPVTGKEWMEPWIDQFAAQGITTGCGGGHYCPENNVTRAEMAVFIGRAYGLYP